MLELGVEPTERLRTLVADPGPSRSRDGRVHRGVMLEATGVALITIRAWCEEGSQHPLRAEIRLADDVASGFRSSVTTVHAEAVMDAVRAFLDNVLYAGSVDPSPHRGHR